MKSEWIPKVGDEVMLPVERGTITGQKGSGTVRTVAPPYVRVLIMYGRGRANLPYLISTLAPLNRPRSKQ
jgi:hypothetical protein